MGAVAIGIGATALFLGKVKDQAVEKLQAELQTTKSKVESLLDQRETEARTVEGKVE